MNTLPKRCMLALAAAALGATAVAAAPWNFVAPFSRDVFGAVAASDGLHVYAGSGYAVSLGGYSSDFARWEPVGNVWTPRAAVPSPLEMSSMVYGGNGKLYLFGGANCLAGSVSNVTRIYDIATDSWSVGAPMPAVRQQMAAAHWNGKVYLAAGYDTCNVTPAHNQLWAYDIAANTWDTSLANVPASFGGAGGAAVGGVFYVAGGRDSGNPNRNSLFGYNIATNGWAPLANLPTGVNVAAATVAPGGVVWVYGGGNPFLGGPGRADAPGAPETTGICQVYTPGTNSWAPCLANLNTARSFVAGATLGSRVMAFTGYNGSTSIATVEVNVAGALPAALSATKTVAGDFVSGGFVTYTVVITNAGPGDQLDNPGNEFSDTLPATLTLLGASATSGTVATVGNTATWNGALANGAAVTLTIDAQIDADVFDAVISNQGTVFYDGDGDGANEASAPTDDPAVGGTADPTDFFVGATLVDIPTLSSLGLALLALVLAAAGLALARRRRAA